MLEGLVSGGGNNLRLGLTRIWLVCWRWGVRGVRGAPAFGLWTGLRVIARRGDGSGPRRAGGIDGWLGKLVVESNGVRLCVHGATVG